MTDLRFRFLHWGTAASVLAAAILALSTLTLAQPAKTGPSGLPIPRFVSLKSNPVNVRLGPSTKHDIAWTFKRASLPVEIVAEFDNWRRIRDWEGEEGWVAHQLLSGRRTALIAPWEKDATYELYSNASAKSTIAARVRPGVLANVVECDGAWCHIEGDNWSGWIEQDKLWGVYPKEALQ